MSQQNVEIVGRVLRRYSNQDIEGMLTDVDSDVEIDHSESNAPDASVYHGHEACRAFVRGRYEDFERRSFHATGVDRCSAERSYRRGTYPGKGPSKWSCRGRASPPVNGLRRSGQLALPPLARRLSVVAPERRGKGVRRGVAGPARDLVEGQPARTQVITGEGHPPVC
jgi:hypothetical protein